MGWPYSVKALVRWAAGKKGRTITTAIVRTYNHILDNSYFSRLFTVSAIDLGGCLSIGIVQATNWFRRLSTNRNCPDNWLRRLSINSNCPDNWFRRLSINWNCPRNGFRRSINWNCVNNRFRVLSMNWNLIVVKSWKTSAVSTTDWMVEAQLCKLRGTSDTFVGRVYSILRSISFIILRSMFFVNKYDFGD